MWSMALAVAALAAAVYCPIAGHQFVDWNDDQAIRFNPDFDPANTQASWRHYWTSPFLGRYMPLTCMAWGVASQFSQISSSGGGYGLDAAGFHALSVVLHCAASAAAFLVLCRFTDQPWAAWLGAAVFAIHPLQVESVAWASSMSILLAGILSLCAMWHYLRFDELRHQSTPPEQQTVTGEAPDRWRALIHYAAGTLAFLLAMLSGPEAIVTPLLLGILVIGVRRRHVRGALGWLGLWLLLGLPLLMKTVGPLAPLTAFPVFRNPLIALDAIGFYTLKLAWPLPLGPDYGNTPPWFLARPLVPIILLVPLILAATAIFSWRRAKWIAASLALFIIALLPQIGFGIFAHRRPATVADHDIYLAMLGPALAMTMGLSIRFTQGRVTLAAAVVLAMAVLSAMQQAQWRDTPTLFLRTLAINPQSAPAHHALGKWYASRGELARAVMHDRAALQDRPHDRRVFYDLGNALFSMDRFQEAIAVYGSALQPDPALPGATPGDSISNNMLPAGERAKAFDQLGLAYLRAEDLDHAAACFNRAVELDSSYRPAQRHLASVQALRAQMTVEPR